MAIRRNQPADEADEGRGDATASRRSGYRLAGAEREGTRESALDVARALPRSAFLCETRWLAYPKLLKSL